MAVTIACPHCSAVFHVEARVIGRQVRCQQCGRTFAALEAEGPMGYEPPPAALPLAPAEPVPTCPHCGNAFPDDMVVCLSCGNDRRTGKMAATMVSQGAALPGAAPVLPYGTGGPARRENTPYANPLLNTIDALAPPAALVVLVLGLATIALVPFVFGATVNLVFGLKLLPNWLALAFLVANLITLMGVLGLVMPAGLIGVRIAGVIMRFSLPPRAYLRLLAAMEAGAGVATMVRGAHPVMAWPAAIAGMAVFFGAFLFLFRLRLQDGGVGFGLLMVFGAAGGLMTVLLFGVFIIVSPWIGAKLPPGFWSW